MTSWHISSSPTTTPRSAPCSTRRCRAPATRCASTGNAATLWRWVAAGEGDLVITDVVMPDENAFDLLPRIKKAAARAAGHRDERAEHVHDGDQGVRARRLRISAQALRPEGTDRHRRPRAVASRSADSRRAEPEEQPTTMPLVGRSPAMQEIYRVAGAADADRPDGDDHRRVRHRQGTGRARAARLRQAPQRALRRHQHGGDPARPDRARAVRPREGRLHRRQHRSAGRFEQAEGGTLFLDEIGDMPMEAQTRLLRVLQQGEYTTVGGRTPIKTNVRIIAATNKDLRIADPAGAVPRGPVLPPQRRAAPAAAAARAHRGHPRPRAPLLLRRPRSEGLPPSSIEPAALERLKRYRWPGNVRELENLVRRLAALYPQETITAADHRAGAGAAGDLGARGPRNGGPRRPLSALGGAASGGLLRRLRATTCRRPASITASCGRSSSR